MALNWFSQIFPCLSVRRVHESTDVPDVVTETRSVSGRQFSGEREYVKERRPSVKSWFNTQRDSFERRPPLESLLLKGPPPRGHKETLSWLDNGNAAGVIAARDAADRSIRDGISSNVCEISYAAEETVITQRDFSRDENGLDLFAVGTPGTGPFTPTLPSPPPTNEAPNQRRGTFPRGPSSLDITRLDRSSPSSSVSTPGCGSRPADWKHLDLPYDGPVWPFGVGYESYRERINALNLAVSKKNQVVEEDSSWKRGSVKSRRPVLHINSQFEAPVAQPRAALVGSPSEHASHTTDLPELPTAISPSDHGRREGDPPEVPIVHSLAAELSDLDDDSSSSSDGPAKSPTAPVNGSGVGSMTSDSDSGQDVHSESPTIEPPTIKSPAIKSPTINKLADADNINPDVPANSPTGVSESSSVKELINDIDGNLDGIAESTARIAGSPKVDKSATDSDNSHIEARPEPSPPIPDGKCGPTEMKQAKKDYWDVASDDGSLDFECEVGSFESEDMGHRTWPKSSFRN